MSLCENISKIQKIENPSWKCEIKESIERSIDIDVENIDSPLYLNAEIQDCNEDSLLKADAIEDIKKETGWSEKICNELIRTKTTWEQYKVYRDAGLKEQKINGKLCLCKDIKLDYVDEKTGMTNRELMEKGRSPIDPETGEKIELHHMGQDYDAPLIELNENSEHGDGNHKILHPQREGSFRQDAEKRAKYDYEKIQHWKARAAEGER